LKKRQNQNRNVIHLIEQHATWSATAAINNMQRAEQLKQSNLKPSVLASHLSQHQNNLFIRGLNKGFIRPMGY